MVRKVHSLQQHKNIASVIDFRRKNGDAKEVLKDRQFFVGIGAQKAGTTWLSDYLKKHPQVFHSPVKELNFFNQLVNNPLRQKTIDFQTRRIGEILLDRGKAKYPPRIEAYQRVIDLLEIGRFREDLEAYLDYFAARIGNEPLFGEISPSYSHLTIAGFEKIREAFPLVKIIFLMRDPVSRMGSHIRHIQRHKELDVSKTLHKLTIKDSLYFRCDYGGTLDKLDEVFGEDNYHIEFYETLFSVAAIKRLCKFLNIEYVKPDLSKRVNVSFTRPISSEFKEVMREKLEPIYEDMRNRFGADLPEKWNR